MIMAVVILLRVVEVIAVLAAWCERGLGWSWREFVKR
jgi:hypothetical protein